MEHNLSELDVNVITLNYLVEDYGHLVDVAVENILQVIDEVRGTQPVLALKLSSVFADESFWEDRKKWALESYFETLED